MTLNALFDLRCILVTHLNYVMFYSFLRVLLERVQTALKRRRNINDPFRHVNGYSWDYMIAFRVYDEQDPVSNLQCQYNMKFVLDKLSVGGLEIRLFYSLQVRGLSCGHFYSFILFHFQRKEVYCKIRCPLRRLQKHADLIDYKLPLDQAALKAACMAGREVCCFLLSLHAPIILLNFLLRDNGTL